jgi:hypothetical protein
MRSQVLPRRQHPPQSRGALCIKCHRVHQVRETPLPERQELVWSTVRLERTSGVRGAWAGIHTRHPRELTGPEDDVGICEVLPPEVERVGQDAPPLLRPEHAPILDLLALQLPKVTLRADEAVAEYSLALRKRDGGHHAIAIEGVRDTVLPNMELSVAIPFRPR